MNVERAITAACAEFSEWMATLPRWSEPPWVGDSRGYSGPTILGEADCRMHLVRFLAKHVPPESLHQEVPISTYLFPSAERSSRSQRIDIGLIDQERLSFTLTAEQMKAVRWNALIEMKFRGDSPGWEFAVSSVQEIASDAAKLTELLPYCDRAHVVVVEEVSPLGEAEVNRIRAAAPGVELSFIRPSGQV